MWIVVGVVGVVETWSTAGGKISGAKGGWTIDDFTQIPPLPPQTKNDSDGSDGSDGDYNYNDGKYPTTLGSSPGDEW